MFKCNVVENEAKRQSSEAFVMFANNAEVELALRQIEGKKIRNFLIKVFRSSEEQFRYYCNVQDLSTSIPLRVNSVPNSCRYSP